jgi:hypothetical protein
VSASVNLRRSVAMLALASVCVLVSPILAQKTDFSGTWKLNHASSKMPKGTSGGSETIYIDCMGSTIRMNVTADTTNQWQTFVSDGEEHIVAKTETAGLIHIASWENSTLVTETITFTWSDVGLHIPTSRFIERWSLSKNGQRLFRAQEYPASVLVYDKQPEAPSN